MLEDPPSVPTLLPEIIVEILSRLPVKSLLRCKSVCKLWHSMIFDPHFVKSHLTLPSYDSWRIVSLDLANETFGEVMQPMYDEGDKDLILGVWGEWLCVLCDYIGNRADVWVMKVYGVKDSWTKLVSIPYLTESENVGYSVPLCITNDGKVLLQFGPILAVYDSKNHSFSKIVDKCIEACTFVESLVSPS